MSTTSDSSAAPTPPIPALALFSLHGSVALVTGAARGIGQAAAIALAEASADVVCVLRRTSSSESTGEHTDVDHRVVPPSRRKAEEGTKPGAGVGGKVDDSEGAIREGGGEGGGEGEGGVKEKEKTQDTIAALGVRAYVVYADLEDMADVKTVWPRALALLGRERDGESGEGGEGEGVEGAGGEDGEGAQGQPRIHILVNCAGVQRRHPSVAFPEADWDTVRPRREPQGVLPPRAGRGAPLPLLRRDQRERRRRVRKGGKIINFCSLLSYQGGFTVPAYAASKGALMQLTKALSNEWAHANVQVNGVSPGYVRTDM
ncbi:hypothetical protein PTI98_008705 [Pleurotus ostreatus]|nr:hypothetical protein PTI98_008705 [Pleurotus ostreatus]